jgi:thiol:disulfide interchange protein DsbC
MLSMMSSQATSAVINADTQTLVKQRLSKLGLTVVDMKDAEVEGLISVFTNRGLFYFSQNGQYMIHGKIYDVKTDITNISEVALSEHRISGVSQFSDSMITFPAKNEKHVVSVFVDSSCGYCRKLHSEMAEYNELGITVQYLAFPRSGTQGATMKELKSAWCSVDKHQAIEDVMSGEKLDSSKIKSCSAPLAEQYALGMQVGVTGTPAIVLADGSMIPGYQPPAQLFAALEASKK